MIFNEKVMYKDQSSTTADVASNESKLVSLDKFSKTIIDSKGVSDGDSGCSAPIPIVTQSDQIVVKV